MPYEIISEVATCAHCRRLYEDDGHEFGLCPDCDADKDRCIMAYWDEIDKISAE